MRPPNANATAQGLSCYTANLLGYLAAEWDGAQLLARSIRTAVRPTQDEELLAFSHHMPSLDRLPDGTVLRYAQPETADDAARALSLEITAHGRALLVCDLARLPWSPAYDGASAPHWLLLDGHEGDRWHARDDFSGLLDDGEQRPHRGWLDTATLRTAMRLPHRWTPQQHLRNALAFGTPLPLPLPQNSTTLLQRTSATHPAPSTGAEPRLGPQPWRTTDTDVLPYLAEYFIAYGPAAAGHLDDLWAAAGHRAFAHRHRLASDSGNPAERTALEAAARCWEALPQKLRFAIESARRQRPRPALIRAAFDELLCTEGDLK